MSNKPARSPKLDVGDALVAAVVQQFFSPTVVGYDMQTGYQPGGQAFMYPVPKFGQSPLAMAAFAIYADRRDEITAKIAEGIDLDALADQVAEKVITGIAERPGYGASLSPTAEQVQRMVRERVADRLSERAIADYDAEQAEMRAAWQREQERMRSAPAELETSTHGSEES